MNQIAHGDRVVWQEGGAGQYTCSGTIINEERYQNGSNPFGHWTIKVDDQCRHRACHTAFEMSRGWVTRSVEFNRLRPEGT
jgi:hypothetical protein